MRARRSPALAWYEPPRQQPAFPGLVSLQRTYVSIFPPAYFNNLSAFWGQENNKLYFFLYALTVFFEQASSRTSSQEVLDSRPFLVDLVILITNTVPFI